MAAVTRKAKRIEKCERGDDDNKQPAADPPAKKRQEGVSQHHKEEQMKIEEGVRTTPGGVPLAEANVAPGNWMAIDRNLCVYVDGRDLEAVREAKKNLDVNVDLALEKASSWEEETLFVEQDV